MAPTPKKQVGVSAGATTKVRAPRCGRQGADVERSKPEIVSLSFIG